ncbi:MAG: hypothetical protein QOJ76_2661, partial [Acidobacteriota bacterium]|nr:hypothetical protein [Acidobacteriota bacterium]
PWRFHIEPESVGFPESDPGFADDMNLRVELQLKKEKAVFPANDIWHSGGARLLAELPASRFGSKHDRRQDKDKAELQGRGRVAKATGVDDAG